MKKIAKRLGSIIVLSMSILLSWFALDYISKTIYLSDGFQKKHLNGIRVVEYVQKKRANIYGDDSSIIPHPYLLYVNKPDYKAQGFVQHDRFGYRIVPPPPDSSPTDTPITILLLGASTTYSFPYIPNPADAWPSVLQKLLGPRFKVINAGLPSATTAEILAGYMFRYRYVKPDIVIFHEGLNDVFAMMFENYNPEYTHLRSPGTRPSPGPIDETLLKWGGWMAMVLYAKNWDNLPTVFTPTPNAIPGGSSPSDAMKMVTESSTEGFERNLALLVRNIRDDGALPVLFGANLAQEKNMSRNRPDLIGREHAWTVGLERNLKIMRRLATDQGLLYLDPAEFKTNEDWYLDNAHLNEAGEAAKAQFVMAGLKPLLAQFEANFPSKGLPGSDRAGPAQ